MEGNVDKDSGAEIHDGIYSLHDIGVCPEIFWPYNISQFKNKPLDECYELRKIIR